MISFRAVPIHHTSKLAWMSRMVRHAARYVHHAYRCFQNFGKNESAWALGQ